MYDITPISCGVGQLSQLMGGYRSARGNSLRAITRLLKDSALSYAYDGCIAPLIIFSDVIRDKKSPGQKIAEYLTKIKAGTITESPIVKNSNTKNSIRVWVWAVPAVKRRKMAWSPNKKIMVDDIIEEIARLDKAYRAKHHRAP